MEYEHGSGALGRKMKFWVCGSCVSTAGQRVYFRVKGHASRVISRPQASLSSTRGLFFDTVCHSREIWFQIRRPANKIYNQAWLLEFLDFGFSVVRKTKIWLYTTAGALKELPISVQIFDCWLANFQSERDLWKLRKPRQLSEGESVTHCKNQRDQSFPMIPRSSGRS